MRTPREEQLTILQNFKKTSQRKYFLAGLLRVNASFSDKYVVVRMGEKMFIPCRKNCIFRGLEI